MSALTLLHAPTLAGQEVSVSAIPLVTRSAPALARRTLTEGYLTQPVIAAGLARGALALHATIDLEGLTLRRGELGSGAWGEGFVDRRHPHTYLHELIAGASLGSGGVRASLVAGRGFAPFGSDDPMVRPFVKYPSNHHLAQILERAVAIAAMRTGRVMLEGGIFNGDEPTGPSSLPSMRRFGDSWAVRGTFAPSLPSSAAGELSASVAAVRSPEYREGFGIDQHKLHAAARIESRSARLRSSAFVEWARTADTERGRTLYTFRSVLAEAAVCRGSLGVAVRSEQSERPEELRLADRFRTERPATDASILGVTRWSVVTMAVAAPRARVGGVRAAPFVEIARARVARATAGAFDPAVLYGRGPLWTISGGLRVGAGRRHERMGRYGAADPHVEDSMSEHTGANHAAHDASSTSDGCFR